MKTRNFYITLFFTLLFIFLYYIGWYNSIENLFLDFQFRLYQKPEKASKDIVLIAIDQGSIDFFSQNYNINWPWPRLYYAKILEYLEKAKAKAIVSIFSLNTPIFIAWK